MNNPLSALLDLLLGYYGTQCMWFWVCVVVILVGLIAIAGNVLEPSRASF